MNLYLRYFDKETLVTSVDEAINFLADIDEIGMNAALEADIREYVASDVFYPKRYKVRPRIYFIVATGIFVLLVVIALATNFIRGKFRNRN